MMIENAHCQEQWNALRNIYSHELFIGKNVVVTGGSRGIGQSIAIAFAALGANVIINYTSQEQIAGVLVDFIKHNGGRASALRFSVDQFSAVQEVFKRIEKEHGTIDILVNNAGISKDNLFVRFKEEDWDAVIDINLKGAFNCSRAVAMGMMKKRSGKIINISSVVGLTGNAGQSAYSASKAGLIGLTKSLALEFASRDIQINAIAPGYIQTDMTSSLPQDTTQKIIDKIPAQKMGLPLDIAKAVVFFASSASGYVTGQTLAVDGGMTMH
jgi:3-oxoacyl-[acyl-carrier protein] reductase